MFIGARCCLVLTAWVAWLAPRRARSRTAMDSMLKGVWCALLYPGECGFSVFFSCCAEDEQMW
jgi:hypothetical protein